MRDRRGIAAIFRIIAGGYLVYLGVKLIRDGLLTGSMQGKTKIIGIAASIAFIVFGVLFIIHAIRFMSRISQEEEETEEEGTIAEAVEEKPAEEPVPPAAPSLFERASRMAALDDDEDEEEYEDEDEEDSPDEDEL